MKLEPRKFEKVSLIAYVILWGVALFGATFPLVLTDFNFSFLQNRNESVLSYLFSLTMIIVLHLIDTAYLIISTTDIETDQLKLSVVANFLFLAIVATWLILSASVSSCGWRIVFFFFAWISLLVVKYYGVVVTKPQVVEIKKMNI